MDGQFDLERWISWEVQRMRRVATATLRCVRLRNATGGLEIEHCASDGAGRRQLRLRGCLDRCVEGEAVLLVLGDVQQCARIVGGGARVSLLSESFLLEQVAQL